MTRRRKGREEGRSVGREGSRRESCERGEGGRGGVLIDDVEKQRLDDARAPCPNQQRQTRTGARHARRGLAKPKRARPPGTRAPLTGSQNTRNYTLSLKTLKAIRIKIKAIKTIISLRTSLPKLL
jgi:hypothetical protein